MRMAIGVGVLGMLIAGCASGASGNGSSPTAKPEPAATAAPASTTSSPPVIAAATEQKQPQSGTAASPAACEPSRETLRGLLGRGRIEAPKEPAKLKLDLPAGMVESALPAAGSGPCSDVGGLGALAAPGRTLKSCCERVKQWQADRFMTGCLLAAACTYSDESGRKAAILDELAQLAAPIDTPSKALGLVALVFPEVLDPSRFAGSESPFGWKGVPAASSAFEVTAEKDGFLVKAPAYLTCGCSHHLFRVSFSVSRTGCARLLDLPLDPLAYSSQPVCVD